MAIDPFSRLLLTPEAAEFLGMSTSFLMKARLRGDGPRYRKFGRAVRYTQSDLEAYLRQSARSSTSEATTAKHDKP